ncbi:hypothetical protein IKS57_03750 [bacterium]|nr:hypothetical protein [bacterium]
MNKHRYDFIASSSYHAINGDIAGDETTKLAHSIDEFDMRALYFKEFL